MILKPIQGGMCMLGEIIAKLRKQRGLSQYALAERLGFSRGKLANYEQGSREPDYETLQKLADYFEVTTDYLLGRENNKVSTSSLDKEYEEFESFFSDPNNRIHFREMAESPEEMREKLWEYWDLLKKARNNKL